MSVDSDMRALFLEEVAENLAELDGALLELERRPEDKDLVNRIFRAVHTIKGACDMFGLSAVVALAHDVESVFDQVRGGWRLVDKALLDLAFAAKDRFTATLCDLDSASAGDFTDLRTCFRELLRSTNLGAPAAPEAGNVASRPADRAGPAGPGDRAESALSDAAGEPGQPDGESAEAGPARTETYRVRLAPGPAGGLAVADPLAFLDELRTLGPCVVGADLSGLPDLADLDPLTCHLAFEAVVETDQGENAVRDVFIFYEDASGLSIERIDGQPASASSDASPETAFEAAFETAFAAASGTDGSWDRARPPAAPAGPAATVSPSAAPSPSVAPADTPRPTAVATAASGGRPETPAASPVPAGADVIKAPSPAGQNGAKAQAPAQARKEAVQSLRVDASKLDDLVNLVGELVIAQARLTQLAGSINHSLLTGVAEEIERLSNELRDNTLGIRMLPIGTTFSRFRRLVRDLSSEMRKQIELVTEGGETELDKTVIEQLGDPLVHLLRNSIDHGVEPPEERERAGKPGQGTIVLSAEHAGGEVVIHIIDDGRGMNQEKIRAKAVEKGLVPPEARLSESEIFNLVFLPGFSTAEKVTNVSGRGVGMDVVKRSMDALRGKIDIHSVLGQGTTITIKLPLTLAIIDGLQVKTGEEYYIIPLSMVEECVELVGRENGDQGSRTIHLRGEIVPYIRLREAFEMRGARPGIEQVVVTRFEKTRTGIAVDEVIGQQQTVIKSLGNFIGNVAGISGATINGDGTMSLILDIPSLVASVSRGR